MKYLVTGGAGFIGSHLAEGLLGSGHRVTALDDLSTGSAENVAHLRGVPGFELVTGSVLDAPLLAELVDACDGVFHLAAAVGVRLVVESPVRTIESNIRCTEEVLRAASAGRRRVLLASTSEVYGKSADLPFREDGDLVLGPTSRGRWSYACSKAIDEFMALAYWRERRVPTVVARLFNVVGPRQSGRYGMVVPRLAAQALAGEPMTVYGDGSQTRCFMHVADAVSALTGLMECEAATGEVFNAGSTEEISIRALAERIRALARSASPIEHLSYARAYGPGFEDMQRRVPCTRRIEALLGWRPLHSTDEVLASVIEHLRESAEAASAEASPGPGARPCS